MAGIIVELPGDGIPPVCDPRTAVDHQNFYGSAEHSRVVVVGELDGPGVGTSVDTNQAPTGADTQPPRPAPNPGRNSSPAPIPGQ